MERLTEWNGGQTRHAYYPRCFKEPCYGRGCKIKDCPFKTAVCERLAAYEDTGLSPEKVSWMKEVVEAAFDNDTSRIERAHNLHVADKEGRCVVLPAKPGEHIFVTGRRKIVECVVDAIYIDQRGPEAVMTFQCDSDCDGCPFYSPLPDPEGDFRCEGELEEAEIGFERFPEIAFLTREEAEKALEAMKDG